MQNLGQLSFEYDVGITDVKSSAINFESLQFTDLSLGWVNRAILLSNNLIIEGLKSLVLDAFKDKISGLISDKVSVYIYMRMHAGSHRHSSPWMG